MHFGKCQLLSRVNCYRVWSGRGVIRAFVGEAAAVRTCVNFCVRNFQRELLQRKGMGGTAGRCVHVCSLCSVCLLFFKSSGDIAAKVSLQTRTVYIQD